MDPHSEIVIGPDGHVLAATDDLPRGLVDVPLGECDSLPRELRDCGKTLLRQLRQSAGRLLSQDVALDDEGRRVRLVAIEAIAIRRQATDLAALLRSKLAVISSQAVASDVTLRILVADDVPPVVHLDAEKVAWAVTTLVGNALRYVQSGSRRLRGGTVDVRVSFDPATADLTIAVKDDGPGVPADSVARLFKHNGLNARGTGLALLLMSDVCAAHGGRIEVQSSTSASDHGTTVRLTFPLHRPNSNRHG